MTRLIRQIAFQVRSLAFEKTMLINAVRNHYHAARLLELAYARYETPAFLRRRLVRGAPQRA